MFGGGGELAERHCMQITTTATIMNAMTNTSTEAKGNKEKVSMNI